MDYREISKKCYSLRSKQKMSRPALLHAWGTRGQNHELIWALQLPLALLSRISSFKWFLPSASAQAHPAWSWASSQGPQHGRVTACKFHVRAPMPPLCCSCDDCPCSSGRLILAKGEISKSWEVGGDKPKTWGCYQCVYR